jgi:hypothetical protein
MKKNCMKKITKEDRKMLAEASERCRGMQGKKQKRSKTSLDEAWRDTRKRRKKNRKK